MFLRSLSSSSSIGSHLTGSGARHSPQIIEAAAIAAHFALPMRVNWQGNMRRQQTHSLTHSLAPSLGTSAFTLGVDSPSREEDEDDEAII